MFRLGARQVRQLSLRLAAEQVKRLQFHEHLPGLDLVALGDEHGRHPASDARTERSVGLDGSSETFSGSTRHLLIISSAPIAKRRPEWERFRLNMVRLRRVARSTGKRTTRRLGWIVVSDQPSAIRLQVSGFTGRGAARGSPTAPALGPFCGLEAEFDNSSGGGPKEVVAARILACIMRRDEREFDELNRPA